MMEFQSWNKRSKKWVKFSGGKIADMRAEKYPGVPVKKGKPTDQEQDQTTEPDQPREQSGGSRKRPRVGFFG